MNRGDAAAATWIFRGDETRAPRNIHVAPRGGAATRPQQRANGLLDPPWEYPRGTPRRGRDPPFRYRGGTQRIVTLENDENWSGKGQGQGIKVAAAATVAAAGGPVAGVLLWRFDIARATRAEIDPVAATRPRRLGGRYPPRRLMP